VLAERAVVRRLDGGCDVPIAAFAEWDDDALWLRARVGATDGSVLIEAEARGSDPEQLGEHVAQMLLAQGAEDLVRTARG
jgi:hydroxymethylbilane synthase